MRLCITISLLLLALTLAQAAPKSIEKKSLVEEKKTALNIDDEGKEKDRAKKSTARFTVEIKPIAPQPGQASLDCKDGQATQVVPAIQSSQVQTVSVSQPSAQLQTLNVVPPSQPVPPTSSSIVIPAQPPAVQPVHTLHILQTVPQPCAQPAQVSFVQPAQPQTLNIIQTPPEPKPAPKPAPQPETEKIIEVVKPEPEQPKPAQVVNIIQPAQQLPEPTETISVLPVEQDCEEEMVVVPSSMIVMSQPEPQHQLATLVQVPNYQQHAMVTECNCHPRNLALLSSMSPQATVVKDGHAAPSFKHHYKGHHAKHLAPTPVYIYSTSVSAPVSTVPSRPSLMVQYNPVQSPISLRSHEVVGDAKKQAGKERTTINYNSGFQPGLLHHSYNPYPVRGYSNTILPSGLTINAYPYLNGPMGSYYRQNSTPLAQYPGVTIQEGNMNSPGASEAMDMLQSMTSKKMPRETDPNVLAAEEANKSIQEITENLEGSNSRTTRSDTDAKIEKSGSAPVTSQ